MGKWDASHDAFHALKVRKLALSLAAEENLPPHSMEIIEQASLLYDIGDHKYSRDESEGDLVERFLESHGVESSKRDKIMSIIKTMGLSPSWSQLRIFKFTWEVFGLKNNKEPLILLIRTTKHPFLPNGYSGFRSYRVPVTVELVP